MAAILYFVIFYIMIFFNIALILIDVHYFDAELSKKNQFLRQNAQNKYSLKNRWRSFCILIVSRQNCGKFKITHNIQVYL